MLLFYFFLLVCLFDWWRRKPKRNDETNTRVNDYCFKHAISLRIQQELKLGKTSPACWPKAIRAKNPKTKKNSQIPQTEYTNKSWATATSKSHLKNMKTNNNKTTAVKKSTQSPSTQKAYFSSNAFQAAQNNFPSNINKSCIPTHLSKVLFVTATTTTTAQA